MDNHTYRPEYAVAAYEMCAEGGVDDRTLSSAFNVSEEVIRQWRARHHDFDQAIEKGKTSAQMQIAQNLLISAANGSSEAQKFCREDPYAVYGVAMRQGRLDATFH